MRLLILFMVLTQSVSALADEFVWWEAERPSQTNFPKQSPFSTDQLSRPDLLSEGDWLSAGGKRDGAELFARYDLEIPEDGEYRLWARKFWRHGPFRWRIGDGDWQVCPRDAALADETHLGNNISANWVFAGTAKLARGKYTFELRLLTEQGEEFSAGIDCFVLTRGLFLPSGKLKPGECAGLAEEGFFPFEPPIDSFADSPIDLRRLNEPVAGQSGFLQRDGNQFTLGDGTPVRFWAVNISSSSTMLDHASIDYMARKLAKLGVNMVRFHATLFETSGDVTRLNPWQLDGLHYTVAALKRQGIYTKLSFYFPVWVRDVKPFGLDGFDGFAGQQPFALIYFDPKLQEIYKGWARQLLSTPNPYIGTELAREPSVGIVEIVNEDSLFFWTLSKTKIPPVQWRRLEEMFSSWAIIRHGSAARAIDAWDGESIGGDDKFAGHLALLEAAQMTSKSLDNASAGKRKRAGDQARFLAELQRGFYSEMTRYFKEELGYGGLISAGNWVTSDSRLLGSIERWTYTAGDVIDRHGYFEPRHEGEASEWSVRIGHIFESRAGVMEAQRVPLQFQQIAGFPQIISELGWPNPNRYRADAAFLSSAYGSLQGVDGLFHFAIENSFLRDTSMRKFSISSPVISGAFPAAALQYRRGDLVEADPVLHQSLNLNDLFAMKGAAAAPSDDALDQFRKQDLPPGAVAEGAVGTFDPLSCYVGPLVQDFDGDPNRSRQRDLSEFIDRNRKTIRSLTGELEWDYGTGVCRVNTPRSQGAAGFLGAAERIELDDIIIECRNEFASVMAIALDDLPLRESKTILVQVMTEERAYGFKTEGEKITDLGGAPFGIRRVDAAVELKHGGVVAVEALDENGDVRSRKSVQASRVVLERDAIYHVLER